MRRFRVTESEAAITKTFGPGRPAAWVDQRTSSRAGRHSDSAAIGMIECSFPDSGEGSPGVDMYGRESRGFQRPAINIWPGEPIKQGTDQLGAQMRTP